MSTWYSLNGGNNHTFTGTAGTVDQNAWDLCSNGTVTIRFYANNTAGNGAFKNITIRKDIVNPQIIVLNPVPYQLCGKDLLNFDLIINEANLGSTWYSLNGGKSFLFTGTRGTIDQNAWDSIKNGTVFLRFYANDTLSNIEFKEITLFKDILAPNITISKPYNREVFGSEAPFFELIIEERNLQKIWYTLDAGINNITCTFEGQINFSLWNELPNGNITILFFAVDSVGNLNMAEVTIEKYIEDNTSPSIFGFHLLYLIMCSLIFTLIIGNRINKKKS